MQSVQSVTTVLLDIDGTLLDSNDAHAQAWKLALRSCGHDVPFERLRPLIGKGGDKLLADAVGIDDDSPEGKRVSEERKRIFAQQFLPNLQPTTGARALLKQLRDNGLQLVVATSAGGEELTGLLKQANVDDLIPLTASSSDAEESKPDPDIVNAALRKADVPAGRAVLLGDTPHDIQAAGKAGVRTIALRCGGWWNDATLSAAAAVYDNPADLLDHLAESPLAPTAGEPRARASQPPLRRL